jgi:hypothetical protein
VPDYGDLVEKHFRRVGIDPAWGHKIMRIESGGNTNNVTGSYKGLFQLDDREFKKHGGTGNIHDPEQNTFAAANMLAAQKMRFKEKYGVEPTLKDMYMIHQQGEAGYNAHMANPDQPAWKNMQQASGRSETWAKKAIWGNIPDKDKARYGSVENVTSKQFTDDVWGGRLSAESALTGRESEVVASYKAEKGKAEAGEKYTTERAGSDKPKSVLNEDDFKMPQPQSWSPSNMVPSIQLPNMPARYEGR